MDTAAAAAATETMTSRVAERLTKAYGFDEDAAAKAAARAVAALAASTTNDDDDDDTEQRAVARAIAVLLDDVPADEAERTDRGGAPPVVRCPHLAQANERSLVRVLPSLAALARCDACDTTDELWMCLSCAHVGCSRYKNKHATGHAKRYPDHALMLNVADKSVWCAACDAYADPRLVRDKIHPSVLHVPALTREPPTTTTSFPGTDTEAHGLLYGERHLAKPRGRLAGFVTPNQTWHPPTTTARVDALARPGYASMRADEFRDTPATLAAKVKVLAKLLRLSRRGVVYSGAGLSTAAGIGDYATKTGTTVTKKVPPLLARPTLSHRVLTRMHQAGLFKWWVNQNHDGLPQKAGFPQHALNEIHGAWFDPTNPVVPMTGNLRDDLIRDLLDIEDQSDMCLALGSSLCGMNADRLVESNASRFKRGDADALGVVIVSLQRTQHDANAALRIYAPLDDVFEMLAAELALVSPTFNLKQDVDLDATNPPPGQVVFEGLPYDPVTGERDPTGKKTMTLDLTPGKLVRLLHMPAWDASQVRKWMPDSSSSSASDPTVCVSHGRRDDGHFQLSLGGAARSVQVRVLGAWWVREAVSGSLPRLPVVNAVSS